MHIARWGNFNSNPLIDNTDRQSLIIISAKTGGITFYSGMNNYNGGYINSKWGKPIGLENITDIENIGLNPNDPILYLKTLLVENIVKINHQGAPIIEYRDRGIWDITTATGDSPYENKEFIKDEVWHNKVKYRCGDDETTEEPYIDSPYWIYLYKIEDGLSNVDIIINPTSVILKADKEDNIENYSSSITSIKMYEGEFN